VSLEVFGARVSLAAIFMATTKSLSITTPMALFGSLLRVLINIGVAVNCGICGKGMNQTLEMFGGFALHGCWAEDEGSGQELPTTIARA